MILQYYSHLLKSTLYCKTINQVTMKHHKVSVALFLHNLTSQGREMA